jgi:hypothetical protein
MQDWLSHARIRKPSSRMKKSVALAVLAPPIPILSVIAFEAL